MFTHLQVTALTYLIAPKYIMTEIWHTLNVIHEALAWHIHAEQNCTVLMLSPMATSKCLAATFRWCMQETEVTWPTPAVANHLLIPKRGCFKMSNLLATSRNKHSPTSLNIFTSDGLAFRTCVQLRLCECAVLKLDSLSFSNYPI